MKAFLWGKTCVYLSGFIDQTIEVEVDFCQKYIIFSGGLGWGSAEVGRLGSTDVEGIVNRNLTAAAI